MTTKSTRKTRKRRSSGASSSDDDYEDDDDDDDDDDLPREEERPGAVAVDGFRAAAVDRAVDVDVDDTVDHSTIVDEAATQENGIPVVLDAEEEEDDEKGLIKAELAPEVYHATSVQIVSEKEQEQRTKQRRNRLIMILSIVVIVAIAIGLGIGFAVGGKSDDANNGAAASSGATTPALAPTVLDPYSESVAYRGKNRDWICESSSNSTNSTFSFLSETKDYGCLLFPPNRTSFPFESYNSFLWCECLGGPIDPDHPPSNERCECDVFLRDFPYPCLWTRLVDTNETEMFQITFDCFNAFADVLRAEEDKSCVGRDHVGDCISNADIPVIPGDFVNTGQASDLNCKNVSYNTQAGVFDFLRGRYDCNSRRGFPVAETWMRSSLYCTEPGYFDENDCNCGVFVHRNSIEFACQSCEVIPNGSNETYQLAYDCSDWFVGDCVGYTENGTCINSADRPEVCTYYDVESCRSKALELGLWLGGAGFTFAGDYLSKGCQHYKSDHPVYGNRAYFGTGAATPMQLEAPTLEGNSRIECDTVIDDPPSTQVCNITDEESCRAEAEARGMQAGNAFYPFLETTNGGCHYYPDIADPSRANTAFWGPIQGDPPLVVFHNIVGESERFFCNVTQNDGRNSTNKKFVM